MTIDRVAVGPYGVELPAHLVNVKTHGPTQCADDDACVIHKPSNHHMRDWPITMRLDREFALCERVCKHGTGHPDPDSLAYIRRMVKAKYEAKPDKPYGPYASDVHGCDGCCRPYFGN